MVLSDFFFPHKLINASALHIDRWRHEVGILHGPRRVENTNMCWVFRESETRLKSHD